MRKFCIFLLLVVFDGVWASTDCEIGYTFVSENPTTKGDGIQYRSHLYPTGGNNNNLDNDLSAGEWKIVWASGNVMGTLHGIASCNDSIGTTNPYSTESAETFDNSADTSNENRKYCWCLPIRWTSSNSNASQSLSGSWIYNRVDYSSVHCANSCAYNCANGVNSSSTWRTAMFDSITDFGQCTANTITINWKNTSGENIETNTCTYNKKLETPNIIPEKRGYVFVGWSFE